MSSVGVLAGDLKLGNETGNMKASWNLREISVKIISFTLSNKTIFLIVQGKLEK